MIKKNISSIELAALVNELQFLVHGKLSQIYQHNCEFLFQVHAQGKYLLKVIPGKWLCLTKTKETPLRPSGLCMQLRKYISNATISKLYQQDSERIVVFELEKKEKYFLIVELFGKGNLILTDKNKTIITAYDQRAWKDRVVKPGEQYVFPSQGTSWKTVTEKELSKILAKSEKRNLATCLATEVGLGGTYAEDICHKAGLDKTMLPGDAPAKLILRELINVQKQLEEPKGFVYESEVAPFELYGQIPLRIQKTYNEAIDVLMPFPVLSPYEQKIAALQRTSEEQEHAIAGLQEKIVLNTTKGELVYGHYQPLQKLLQIVAELRKTLPWEEIKKRLVQEKKIKHVDLKNKKICIDL